MTTDHNTIFLICGIAFIFLGIIGGGLKIKEISIPKLNNFARVAGIVVGVALIGLSQFAIKDPSITLPSPAAINDSSQTIDSSENQSSDESLSSEEPMVDPRVIAEQKFEETMRFFEDLEVNNDVLLGSFHAMESDPEIFQNLNPKQQSQIINSISALEKSIGEITALQKQLSNNQLTVKERLEGLRHFHEELGVTQLRISALDERRINALTIPLEMTSEGSATLASADEFKTCQSVDRRTCLKETSRFRKAEPVHFWARVAAPKNARISVELLNKENRSRIENFHADVSPSDGFRVHFSKRIADPGEYEVLLKNEDGLVIGKNQFKVI